MVDAEKIKEGILSVLKTGGPSIPVNLATEVKSTILFTSAFLSELVSEKRVKMSNMRVGSSPIYFLPGQEHLLEPFSQHLKSKEKEAFVLLKEKRFLGDKEQNPAIRVALREIRDFAVPFKSEGEIVWRYFLVPESEFKAVKVAKIPEEELEKPLEIKMEKPVPIVAKTEMQKPLDIFGKEEKKAKPRKKKSGDKEKENEFLNRIKEFLSANSIDLLETKSSNKKEITLRIKDKESEKILVAYNKRKISDNEILKAHKKSLGAGLPYMVLGLSEPTKKTSELVKAVKNLSSIHGLKS